MLPASAACLLAGLTVASQAVLAAYDYRPHSWGIEALFLWLAFIQIRGLSSLVTADVHQISWGLASIAAFFAYLWYDSSFQSWGDVYFFCGPHMQFCSCDLEWNLGGWLKALVLWNFVLTSVLAIQKLIIEVGLNGLLPGEEVVTKDSFISICWRLIPYCLNNWEKKWGAECTSMMFELPHFALELLVVLPVVQIMCSRLKVLTIPAARHMQARRVGSDTADLAPAIMQGVWQPLPGHHRFLIRLRYNLRPLLVVAGVIVLAILNAVVFPMELERQVLIHPRAEPLIQTALQCERDNVCWSAADVGLSSNPFSAEAQQTCPAADTLRRSLLKHASEILKMQHPVHKELLPLVECALAALRMSCEKFFLLVSLFTAYLLYFTRVPWWFKYLVRINHRLSKVFQKAILYTFPAVCWVYGAGAIFSSFVSLIFWFAPAKIACYRIRSAIVVVHPVGLKDASRQEVENMNNNCTVCWLPMNAACTSHGAARPASVGKALTCGHAFHGPCIQKWLTQCHGQNRLPTCPLCNRAIQLQIKYQLSKFWKLHGRAMDVQPEDDSPDEGVPDHMLEGLLGPEQGPHRAIPSQAEQRPVHPPLQQDLPQTNQPLAEGSSPNSSSMQDLQALTSDASTRDGCLVDAQPDVGSTSDVNAGKVDNAWAENLPLPMHLVLGAERRSSLKYRRRRLRARFSLPTQTSPGLTRVELPNVQQIKHRGEACMELCQAEEARRKAQIQQCPGCVQHTADLLANTASLEDPVVADKEEKWCP